MKSRYGELDAAQKVSVILGILGGSVLLLVTFSLLTLWEGPLTPGADFDPSLVIVTIIAFAMVTLTPFFLYAASLVLMFASLSRETRGILGFLLFIGGVVATLFLFPFLLVMVRVS